MNSRKLKKLQALLYSCELCDHVCRDFNDLDLHVKTKHLDSSDHPEKHVEQKSKPQSQKASGSRESRMGIIEGDQRLTASVSVDSQPVGVSALVTSKVWQQKKKSLKFTCNYCPRDFKSEVSRRYHEKSQCSAKSGPLNTENDSDAVRETQIIHVVDSDNEVESSKSYKHSVERPFQCNYCEKTYKTKRDLKEHKNIHIGHKPFKCKYCFKAFFYHQALHYHTKRCLAVQKN